MVDEGNPQQASGQQTHGTGQEGASVHEVDAVTPARHDRTRRPLDDVQRLGGKVGPLVIAQWRPPNARGLKPLSYPRPYLFLGEGAGLFEGHQSETHAHPGETRNGGQDERLAQGLGGTPIREIEDMKRASFGTSILRHRRRRRHGRYFARTTGAGTGGDSPLAGGGSAP